jgi:rhamnose transport system ATP-binding protein
MNATAPVLEVTGVSKRFGGVQALMGVDLFLRAGSIHALLGENGAGKSTLVKIIAGVYRPDTGTMRLNGAELELRGPAHARQLGIAVIHQEPSLFPDLEVAENIFMGHPPRDRWGRVDWRRMRAEAQKLFAAQGVSLRVTAPVLGLSVADQQLVEISKALSFDARVLVMDEPTAALSPREVERLFGIVRQLRDRGVAVLFVSHRLEEIFELCDEVTVLRDGAHVITAPVADLTVAETIRHMVGRRVETLYPKQEVEVKEVALEVRQLSRAGAFRNVSFSVRRGEILGLAGLVGAGRTEVARVIFGIDRADSGQILVRGKAVNIDSPWAALSQGIAYLPEDRHQHGLILDFPIASNITLPILRRVSRGLFLERRRERAIAEAQAARLQVRATSVDQLASALSGGNQQKVVLAKWLAAEPSVLILDEPTRGVDIGAKAEVHRIMSQLAAEGMALILISSELPEMLGMADRVVVMHEGTVTAEFDRRQADPEKVMFAATGQARADG